ncbi:MAG TPA: IPT/TIG domain-containing protein, partial [Tahibacter sp.]|nr:IPT/TIG domain-containing protein [Tahibacter sp.]
MAAALCAQAASYTYDASGRLVAVTNASGETAVYRYDALGNMLGIDRLATGQLALFAFSPTHGGPGASVSVKGQGFTGASSVTFNGAAATVIAASANQLDVTVPAGATTGPLSVTVGAASVTSAQAFSVDGTGLPPTITAVSPTVVSAGATISVAGTHLQPIPGTTTVALNGRAVSVGSLSDVAATFVVPASTGGGKVTVGTPYGTASSGADVLVLPGGIVAGDVVQQSRMSAGTPVSLNVPDMKYAAVLFDGNAGDWASLQLSNVVTAGNRIDVTVYDTTNRQISTASLTGGVRSAHLPQFGQSGTYLALIRPFGGSAALDVRSEVAPVLVRDAAPTLPLSTSVAGQSRRIIFNAASGERLFLGLTQISTSTPYNSLTISAADHIGQYVYSPNCGVPTCAINFDPFKFTGAHSVIVGTDPAATFNTQLRLATAIVAPLTLGGGNGITSQWPGQAVYLPINGVSAGQNLGIGFTGVASTPGGWFSASVYKPDGSYFQSAACYASSGACDLNLASLPASGSYLLAVVPPADSTVAFGAYLTA